MGIKKLKKKYESCCNDYVAKFCKKQGLESDGWVAEDIGGIVLCGDYFFNFQDIVWDVNSKQPKDLIFDWYNESLEYPKKAINYYSYSQGLRYENLENKN